MKAPKLKWAVCPAPEGRFRSFETRGFPSADYENGHSAAKINCELSYLPEHRYANDLQLTVYVAEWYVSDGDNHLTFRWRKLKRLATSIAEAKEMAAKVLKQNPDFVHPDYR